MQLWLQESFNFLIPATSRRGAAASDAAAGPGPGGAGDSLSRRRDVRSTVTVTAQNDSEFQCHGCSTQSIPVVLEVCIKITCQTVTQRIYFALLFQFQPESK